MSKEREIRVLLLEQKRIEREIERVYQEVILLERSMNEIRNATQTLTEMKGRKIVKGETLFPIGGGVFVFGTLSEKNKVLINIGANIYLTKTIEETLKILNDNFNYLGKAHTERINVLNELRKRYDQITEKLLEYQVSAGGR